MTDRPLTPLMEAALRHLDRIYPEVNTPSNIGRAIGVQGKPRSSIGYRLTAVWRGLEKRGLIRFDSSDYYTAYAATQAGRQWVADHPESNA